MADTSVQNLNADFVGLRRSDFNVFEGEILACLPGDGALILVSKEQESERRTMVCLPYR